MSMLQDEGEEDNRVGTVLTAQNVEIRVITDGIKGEALDGEWQQAHWL